MNREIKFRAWDKVNQKMIYISHNNERTEFDEGNIRTLTANEFFDLTKPVTEKVIMQFTGLRDKNGKDIYEGDILRRSIGYYVVMFGEVEEDKSVPGNFEFIGFYVIRREVHGLAGFYFDELVGNIYENPELIEEGTKEYLNKYL